MTLARAAHSAAPLPRRSPLPGYEHVRGYGVLALPFSSGHVLALRVSEENDFAPYTAVWHRAPDGGWSLYVDGSQLEKASPRYFGAAARRVRPASITLRWTGPASLDIEMEAPSLEWSIAMSTPPLWAPLNVLGTLMPASVARYPAAVKAMTWAAGFVYGLGDVSLMGTMPDGQAGVMLPQRLHPIFSTVARLDGEDLGDAVTLDENPTIGRVRLPSRPVFAIADEYYSTSAPSGNDVSPAGGGERGRSTRHVEREIPATPAMRADGAGVRPPDGQGWRTEVEPHSSRLR